MNFNDAIQPDAAFQTGPYGEILPPPLLGGIDPDTAINLLVEASQLTSSPITAIPSRGHSRDGLIDLALLYVHQANLARAISGEMPNDPDAALLHRLVTEQQQPLSLRPLGYEDIWTSTFVPILKYINPHTEMWQLGLIGQGRSENIFGTPTEVISAAQVRWAILSGDEEDRWEMWSKQAIKNVSPRTEHLVWQAALSDRARLRVDLGTDFALERLGTHSTYRIWTPKGFRIFETSTPLRAAKIAQQVLARFDVPLPTYTVGDVKTALADLNAPAIALDQFVVGDRIDLTDDGVIAKRLDEGRIGIIRGNHTYGLRLTDDGVSLGLIEKGRIKKVLGQLVMPSSWTETARIQIALSWAIWQIGGAS